MTHANNLTAQHGTPGSLTKRMLIGAAVGLAVILFFVLQVNHPHPEWGRFWMIRPLLITPLAGAMAGLFSYFMAWLHREYAWNKILTVTLSTIVFVIGIWMGIILGLDGTLWH